MSKSMVTSYSIVQSSLLSSSRKGADGRQVDYFIFIEKAVVCKVNTFAKAIIFWFVSHYVFNLEYEMRL